MISADPKPIETRSPGGEPAAPRRATAAGMSIIEVLIAASLLLVIALGILALLTRSIASGNRGLEATVASNHVRNQLDHYLGEPLLSPSLDIANGNVEEVNEEFWAQGSISLGNDDDEGWYPDEASAQGLVLLRREATIRQYNVKSLLGDSDGLNDEGQWQYEITQGNIDSPLPGGTDPEFIHVKRIQTTLEGEREGGALGAGQRMRTETYKSF